MGSLKIDGTVTSDPAKISQHITAFYKNPFSVMCNVHSDSVCICHIILHSDTEDENQALTSRPTVEEICNIIFSMDGDSAPGLNGFKGKFY